MYFRVLALGLLIVLAFGAGQLRVARAGATASPEAAAIVLLPPSIDGYRIERSWDQTLFGQRVREQGALYAPLAGAADADAVQLDFYRNSRSPHNGAGCYLGQGEALRSEMLRTLKTRTGTALFDVVIMQADDHLRLAAATECTAEGCSETKARGYGWAPWQRWRMAPLVASGAGGVVPFSIVLEHGHIAAPEQVPAIEIQLQREFEAVAAQLDLLPAQHLAAAVN